MQNYKTTFASGFLLQNVQTAPVNAKTTRLHLLAGYYCIRIASAKGRVISLRGESLYVQYFSFHQKRSDPFLQLRVDLMVGEVCGTFSLQDIKSILTE